MPEYIVVDITIQDILEEIKEMVKLEKIDYWNIFIQHAQNLIQMKYDSVVFKLIQQHHYFYNEKTIEEYLQKNPEARVSTNNYGEIEYFFSTKVIYYKGIKVHYDISKDKWKIISLPNRITSMYNLRRNNSNAVNINDDFLRSFETILCNGECKQELDIAELSSNNLWKGIITHSSKHVRYKDYALTIGKIGYTLYTGSGITPRRRNRRYSYYSGERESDTVRTFFERYVTQFGLKKATRFIKNTYTFEKLFAHKEDTGKHYDQFVKCMENGAELEKMEERMERKKDTQSNLKTISDRILNAVIKIKEAFETDEKPRCKQRNDCYYTISYTDPIRFNMDTKEFYYDHLHFRYNFTGQKELELTAVPDGSGGLERYDEFKNVVKEHMGKKLFKRVHVPDVATDYDRKDWHDIYIDNLDKISLHRGDLTVEVNGITISRPYNGNGNEYTEHYLYKRYLKEVGLIGELRYKRKFKIQWQSDLNDVEEIRGSYRRYDSDRASGYVNTIFKYARKTDENYQLFKRLMEEDSELEAVYNAKTKLIRLKAEAQLQKLKEWNDLPEAEKQKRINSAANAKKELALRKRQYEEYINAQIHFNGKDLCVVCGGHVHNLRAISQAFPKNMFEGGLIDTIGGLCCGCFHEVIDKVKSGEEVNLEEIMEKHSSQREKNLEANKSRLEKEKEILAKKQFGVV